MQLLAMLVGLAAMVHCSRRGGPGRRCWMGLLQLMAGAARQAAAPSVLQLQGTSRQCPRHAAW